MDKFDPRTLGSGVFRLNFFYITPRWQQWLTPLDQPVIRRRGPIMGPKA
ncbi:MAG: hypothetical protein ACOCX5_01955 [Chloroflexota bacterium]